jgi:BirA family transcriptional regulator, biotin operon repressor / biotin---[acetyl-CoA-carboxylase] ligase
LPKGKSQTKCAKLRKKIELIAARTTLFVGKIIHHFEELPSTNLYAAEFAAKNKPSEGTVISTYQQTQGKGQHDGIWESAANKNLTLSVLLQPNFLLPKHQFWLSQAVALAVRDFVADLLPQKKVFIKWSNDIFVENRKIAGILIQNTLTNAVINSSIVGIGINVNQTDFGFVADRRPTSLALETGEVFHLDHLRQALFWYLETRYLQLKANKVHLLQTNYMDVLYQYETPSLYELPNGERFTGIIKGIAPHGQLVVERAGELLQFSIKEIRFL